ncbi:MAG: VPLPA-CTERM sorting domain-containing protein [Boseongicola sp.]
MSIFRVIPLSAGLFFLAVPASALTLTFDEPPFNPFVPYAESGFVVEDGGYFVAADGALHFDIFGGPYADERTITREDGGAFSVDSLDVISLYPSVDAGGLIGDPLADINFLGFNGADLVNVARGSSQIGDNTIEFGDLFSEITSFLISGFDPGNIQYEPDFNDVHFLIDNLEVSIEKTDDDGPLSDPVILPLPAAGWLLLAGLGGLGFIRFRRRAGNSSGSGT